MLELVRNLSRFPHLLRKATKSADTCGTRKSIKVQKNVCSLPPCKKSVYQFCSEQLLCDVDVPTTGSSSIEGFPCSRRCFKKLREVLSDRQHGEISKTNRILWSEDDRLAVFMNCIIKKGNYERYFGRNTKVGRTRESHHSEIKLAISGTESCSETSEKDVFAKMRRIGTVSWKEKLATPHQFILVTLQLANG